MDLFNVIVALFDMGLGIFSIFSFFHWKRKEEWYNAKNGMNTVRFIKYPFLVLAALAFALGLWTLFW